LEVQLLEPPVLVHFGTHPQEDDDGDGAPGESEHVVEGSTIEFVRRVIVGLLLLLLLLLTSQRHWNWVHLMFVHSDDENQQKEGSHERNEEESPTEVIPAGEIEEHPSGREGMIIAELATMVTCERAGGGAAEVTFTGRRAGAGLRGVGGGGVSDGGRGSGGR